MYKIGDFSILSKTTIKTLRFYEKEGIFKPSKVDNNGYRYYDSSKLLEISKIIALKQLGFSLNEIKKIIKGAQFDLLLKDKLKELENIQLENDFKISKIKHLLGENMNKQEVVIKELPNYIVYYKECVVKDFSEISNFILTSGEECIKLNPNLKCVEPDYCYLEYLDKEYKDKDIKIRYAQAVTEFGKENETIKFKQLKPVKAVCIYHKGSYDNLNETYDYIFKYIAENKMQIANFPRERYIDGIWNKENVKDWLTEIQIPIK